VDGGNAFIELRDRLLLDGIPQTQASQAFHWPAIEYFNWALDYFDRIAAGNERPALRVVDDAGGDRVTSFAELARRSNQVANFLASRGVGPGDRVLIMLGNVVALWETMLATIKLGAVMIPATTLLQRADLQDRLARGRVLAVVTDRALAKNFDALSGAPVRIVVGGAVPGWIEFENSNQAPSEFRAPAPTPADALMLLYFTSGTTAKPKLVAHSHTSYPVGHLSTAYWIGLRPRRRASELEFAGLGEACVVVLLCALEFRGDGARLSLRAISGRRAARSIGALPRHDVLRSTDGVAHADSRGPAALAGRFARGGGCGRAAEPGGYRPREGGMGPDHPRWLRPDRDDGANRQSAGRAIEAGVHGAAAARLHRCIDCGRWQCRRTRGRSASTCASARSG
jgi:hypothetical protein